MRISVSHFRELPAKKGDCKIRFAVTWSDSDGDPLCTQEGYIIDKRWRPTPPKTRGEFGRGTYKYTHISPRFSAMLVQAISRYPGVVERLGPAPIETMDPEGPPEIRGAGGTVMEDAD